MDYQCECGEEFDIYMQHIRNRVLEMDDFGEVVCNFSVVCPKCGKEVRCVECFTYVCTELV